MADQKITDFELIDSLGDTDVLPIVKVSTNSNKKTTIQQLKGISPVQSVNAKTGAVVLNKSDLGLGNVDNTSDADKPISSATQTALDGKVDENSAIIGATKTKITYDAKGLVTAGADATTSDIADSTDKRYVSDAQLVVIGNTSGTNSGDDATNTQYSGLATSKQDTLVSGTNIKTINSTSLLGSGDIAISASPSGVAGAIQFSNGSAFASDATNLFWDDTNNRLGIGTTSPTKALTINANVNDDGFILRGATGSTIFSITKDGASNNTSELFQYSSGAANFAIRASSNPSYFNAGSFTFGATTNLGAKVNIKGTGATSATTSLLVQNSAGTSAFTVRDDLNVIVGGGLTTSTNATIGTFMSVSTLVIGNASPRIYNGNTTNANLSINNTGVVVSTSSYSTSTASAVLEAKSTTQGFLPPRMTTAEKNAISAPASGLVVYDTTTNKLCCYNGTSWNDLF